MDQKFMLFFILNILFLILTIDSQLKIARIPKYLKFDEGFNRPLCGLTHTLDLIETNWFEDCYDNKCCLNPYEEEVYIKNRHITGPKMRIYKGEQIDNTESPWTVHILPKQWHGLSSRTCTGVLISLEWVLTAAHCFEDWKNDGWIDNTVTITAGSNSTSKSTKGLQQRTNSNNKWYSHYKYINPEYGESGIKTKKELQTIKSLHDIALFKVSKPFKRIVDNQKYRINPICLPQMMIRDEIIRVFNRKQNATLYGFSPLMGSGLVFGFHKINGLLRSGSVKLNSYMDCDILGFLCSKSIKEEPRSCDGDSGGPLVQHINNSLDDKQHKNILIGILYGAIGGKYCGDQVNQTLYVPVPMFTDWIFYILSRH